jgi:glycosyltransferase involved in cell wall biosynthesis
MFKNSGVTVPITVLTLGVDTSFYTARKRAFPKNRPFRFLTMGKLEPRKNTATLVSCFQDAFKDENVELIIKTRERFLPTRVRIANTNDSRIKIIEKTLSEEELKKLFYYADAFIYPSKGEGFAFPPRNAVASGLPTVVTGWSALNEIPGAIKIPPSSFGPMPPCGFSYGQEKELHMANIDEVTLINEMYSLATDKEYYEHIAETTYNTDQPTWEQTAKQFISAVERYAK